MGKELIDIREKIEASSEDFYNYLITLLPQEVLDIVDVLSTKTNVYLFSGVIRDYFIDRKDEFRDVDFVVEDDLDINALFPDLTIRRNSFGGYKISINSISVDLWNVKDTWGLKQQSVLPFVDFLPETTFFNSSSILFSFNDKRFIVGEPFLKFLRNKRNKSLDIVLENNPEPALCIVNSVYYAEKYNFQISKKLSSYISENYNKHKNELEIIQEKHFRKVIYDTENIEVILKNILKGVAINTHSYRAETY